MIFRSQSLRHFNNRPSVDTVSWSYTAFFFEQQTRLTIPLSISFVGAYMVLPSTAGLVSSLLLVQIVLADTPELHSITFLLHVHATIQTLRLF